MSPRRIASATACARSTAPSFWKITCRRFFTATSVRPVARPISRLVAPLLARRRISRSSEERSVVRWVCSRARPPNSSQYAVQELRTELATTAGRGTDSCDQFLGWSALEEVPIRTRFQRLSHVSLIAVRGEDDDGNVIVNVTQPPRGLHAAGARHPQIEQDDIGMKGACLLDRAGGVVAPHR